MLCKLEIISPVRLQLKALACLIQRKGCPGRCDNSQLRDTQLIETNSQQIDVGSLGIVQIHDSIAQNASDEPMSKVSWRLFDIESMQQDGALGLQRFGD